MAKLRMTYKNLKALRKSKEYQALLVDLVACNIVPKATAEGLLGYNIPANLIGGEESTTEEPVVTPSGGTEGSGTEGSGTEGSGTEGSGTEGSGTEGSGTEGSDNTVTLLYFDATANDNAGEWLTAEYDLTDDPTGAGILAFAKTEFGNDTINNLYCAEIDPEYVEGESDLDNKYISLDPQPETLEPGMLMVASGGGTQDTVVSVGN